MRREKKDEFLEFMTLTFSAFVWPASLRAFGRRSEALLQHGKVSHKYHAFLVLFPRQDIVKGISYM